MTLQINILMGFATRLSAIVINLSVIFILFSFTTKKLFATDKHGDAYVAANISDIVTLNPVLASDAVSYSATSMVFNGLTKIDHNLNIVGDLAERWVLDVENLTIVFYLRQNALWHDGYPVTAEDVKFTFDLIQDPANGYPYISTYQSIRSIEIIDTYKIKFYLKEAWAPILSKMGISILPKHIFEKEPIRHTRYNFNPIGSGPYQFKKWKKDQYLILESYQEYFEKVPFIDTYVIRVIPDSSIQYLNLISGDIDSCSLSSYQYLKRTDTKYFQDRFDKYKTLARSYTYVGFNLKDNILQDQKVRRALNHAVNKSDIIDGVLLGLGEECTGPFFKSGNYYNEEVDSYFFDINKSKELLKEAGWHDTDQDGILDKDGQPLEVTMLINQGNDERKDAAIIIQRQWEAVGVDCRLRILSWPSLISNFINTRNFQAVLLGWTVPIDPDPTSVWHSSAIKGNGLNFISYKNDEVDRLIEKGRREMDVSKREPIYKKIHALIANDAPYIFLYYPYELTAISKRFKNVRTSKRGIGYNFIEWYVDAQNRKYNF